MRIVNFRPCSGALVNISENAKWGKTHKGTTHRSLLAMLQLDVQPISS